MARRWSRRLASCALRIIETENDAVKHQAVHTLTLLAWVAYSKEDTRAPPFEFLYSIRNKQLFGLSDSKVMTDEEKIWNSTLDAYQFGALDDFDVELNRGIQRGFFDESELLKAAALLQKKLIADQV